MAKKHTEKQTQSVDVNISPIYVPLEPEWADTVTMQEPLMARGDFSNSWVVYEEDELPEHTSGPSALSRGEQTESSRKKTKE